MIGLSIQRTISASQVAYILEGAFKAGDVDNLTESIEIDLRTHGLLVRIDVSRLQSAESAAIATIEAWLDEVNETEVFVEVAGEWPESSSDSAPGGLFSLPSSGTIEQPDAWSLRAKVQDTAEDADSRVRRYCSVRYYRKMYPHRHYPLIVLFTKAKLRKLRLNKVASIDNAAVFELMDDETTVEVRVVFPGCVTAPEVSWVDLSEEHVLARFWITPISIGLVKHAYVEIWNQDALLARIDTPARIVRQRKAIASLATGFLLPLLSVGAKIYAEEIRDAVPVVGQQAVELFYSFSARPENVWVVTVVLFAIAGGYFVANLPKKSPPIESTLTVHKS